MSGKMTDEKYEQAMRIIANGWGGEVAGWIRAHTTALTAERDEMRERLRVAGDSLRDERRERDALRERVTALEAEVESTRNREASAYIARRADAADEATPSEPTTAEAFAKLRGFLREDYDPEEFEALSAALSLLERRMGRRSRHSCARGPNCATPVFTLEEVHAAEAKGYAEGLENAAQLADGRATALGVIRSMKGTWGSAVARQLAADIRAAKPKP